MACSSTYGAGLDLFDPATRFLLERRPIISGNPGSRERWDVRPSWHSIISGTGKTGTGTEKIVSPEARFAWPVVYGANGRMGDAPEGSEFHAGGKRSRPVQVEP